MTWTPPFFTRSCAQVWAEVLGGSLMACWMKRLGQEESRRLWWCKKFLQSSREALEQTEIREKLAWQTFTIAEIWEGSVFLGAYMMLQNYPSYLPRKGGGEIMYLNTRKIALMWWKCQDNGETKHPKINGIFDIEAWQSCSLKPTGLKQSQFPYQFSMIMWLKMFEA